MFPFSSMMCLRINSLKICKKSNNFVFNLQPPVIICLSLHIKYTYTMHGHGIFNLKMCSKILCLGTQTYTKQFKKSGIIQRT